MTNASDTAEKNALAGEIVEYRGVQNNRIVGEIWKRTVPGNGDEKNHPILLLHGGGQTRHAWQETAHRLVKRGYTVIAVDQRGHGESEWLPGGNYSFDFFARDILTLSKSIQDDFGCKAIVVGASLGGIGALLAEGHYRPGNCKALILVDITPRVSPLGVSRILEFMAAKAEQGFASLEEAADAISSYLPNRKRPDNLDGLKKNLRLGSDGRYRWHWDPKFVEQRGEYDINSDVFEDLMINSAKSLNLPVLLLRGSRSDLVEEEHVEEFRKLVPHASYVDVSGAGHMIAGDKNDIFAEALINFIDSLYEHKN